MTEWDICGGDMCGRVSTFSLASMYSCDSGGTYVVGSCVNVSALFPLGQWNNNLIITEMESLYCIYDVLGYTFSSLNHYSVNVIQFHRLNLL